MDQTKREAILKELDWSFSRSSGPGGQHVNTTDSKAKMCWSFQKSLALRTRQKDQVKRKLANYIKGSDVLQLTSSSNRSREMNKKSCISKLFYLLEKVAFKKEKARIKTRPTRSSVEKRITSKKRKGDVKSNRKKVNY